MVNLNPRSFITVLSLLTPFQTSSSPTTLCALANPSPANGAFPINLGPGLVAVTEPAAGRSFAQVRQMRHRRRHHHHHLGFGTPATIEAGSSSASATPTDAGSSGGSESDATTSEDSATSSAVETTLSTDDFAANIVTTSTALATSITAVITAATPTETGGDTPSLTTANAMPVPTESQSIDGSTLVLVPVQANSSDILALTSDVYRHRAQMGVNLGGWFVAEEWMQPDYFQCATNNTAEINIAEGCSQEWMENHWDTWITEQDFALMASAGVNTARLPVGYWSVGADNCNCENTAFWPYMAKYDNSWERVLRAIGWAAEYGIGILLDMHGVEGSQNGWAHSGIFSGKVEFPYNTEFQAHTIEVFKYMATTLVGLDNVVGFELINEPFPSPLDAYTAFYDAAMTAMRPILGDDFPFYMFTNSNNWNIWMKKQGGFLVSDYHNYYVFGSLPNDNLVQVTENLQTVTTPYIESWAPNLIIGEWTCAPGSVHTGTAEDEQAYCAAQFAAYMSTEIAGNHYWNWNMGGEYCNGWSFLDRTGMSGRCSSPQYLQPLNGASSFSPTADIATVSGNDLAVSSNTTLVASTNANAKRELYRRAHGDKADIWEHGCVVAKIFAAANSKLGFAAQWVKSKGRATTHEIDDAGYLRHFKEGLGACA